MFWQNFLTSNSGYGLPTILLIIVLAWLFFWKGYALWRAARNGQKYWFIALLLVSTVGILEIVYLSFFQKPPQSPFKGLLKRLKFKGKK
ncbi:hypothetical protein A2865_00145 [Candidatus Woesebacteria bacterium RIFCSPHIGHO2_01_FULL_39_17]|uniref:DUF5652 domain-containing protein n=1 Tax=Candidatus Woesebacteria bacterium RIFCSPLOWO2_01_FULL_39_14 TaxID=1802518 RepID=A0A1F8BN13_9BACT|nr:MAG: hypothetical protein A2865_00145 [Candidatus Woesebacteria bacterium RIFCSPHIGHO2_01_FULL_39_17]OGM65464.1 MAG: hypothetical protein A3A52_00885 [Candidatus Woesebacteria bacterium RIFCSPLOWO2_01_FULL_39_14]